MFSWCYLSLQQRSAKAVAVVRVEQAPSRQGPAGHQQGEWDDESCSHFDLALLPSASMTRNNNNCTAQAGLDGALAVQQRRAAARSRGPAAPRYRRGRCIMEEELPEASWRGQSCGELLQVCALAVHPVLVHPFHPSLLVDAEPHSLNSLIVAGTFFFYSTRSSSRPYCGEGTFAYGCLFVSRVRSLSRSVCTHYACLYGCVVPVVSYVLFRM